MTGSNRHRVTRPPCATHPHHRPHRLLGPLRQRRHQRHPEEAIKNAFGWTQYDGHGPGDELLTALELGSGRGHAVAALTTKGIDLSPAQVHHAQQRWNHLPGARSVRSDVFDMLTNTHEQWDAIYSIWGALWFTNPEHLLPLVRDRLTPRAG